MSSFSNLKKINNSIKYTKLKNIGKICMCKRILKKETNTYDGIPFFTIATLGEKAKSFILKEKFLLYKQKYNYPSKGEILISCSGTIGKLVIFNGNDSYFQDSNIVWIKNNEKIIKNKFLYYFLKTNPWNINNQGTIKRLYNKIIEELEIPIPPLETQNKIVNILDNFSKYEAELEAELVLRNKQYEYYRNKLLSFDNLIKDVEYKKLEEICEIKRGKVISKNYINANKGKFPVYSSQTINEGIIGKISSYDFDGEYITWTTDGIYAGTAFYRKGKFSITNICGLLKVKVNNILPKFIYYYLKKDMRNYVNKSISNPKLMSNKVAEIQIPIPPLETQNKIVNILDKFNTLLNDINEGLPKEKELRKKQYEYYRDKLLNF